MLLDLVQGVAVLLALCMLQSFNLRLWPRDHPGEKISSGLLFGAVCILGMMVPISFMPGVIFDARSVVLSMAGLFGGPLVALIAALMAASYRLWIGGAGVWIGLSVIVFSSLLGLAYRAAHARNWLKIGVPQLFGFGLLVNTGVVLLLMLLPAPIATQIWRHVAPPYIPTFAVATVLLGLMLQDLQQLSNSRAALEASEGRLRAIVHAIPDLLFVIDEEGYYLEVLSSDSHLLYAQAADILGKRMHDILPQADADRFLAVVRDTLNQQQALRLEYSLQTLSGVRYFEGHTQALPSPVNGRRAVVFLARDISNSRAQHDALAQMARVTTEQNQRLKQFTYIVSHNIRSQVANQLGLIQLIELQGESEREALWKMLCKSVERLDEVICHLNSVTQIHHQQALSRSPKLLRQEVAHALDELAIDLRKAQARVSNQVPAALEVWVVPAYLDSILFNVLSNALKYADPGRQPEIVLSVTESPEFTILHIQDNGMGLNLAQIGHKLFGLYQTFHAHPEARGLGLFLSKAQCEAMGGRIEVESQPGQGSSFQIFFAKSSGPAAPNSGPVEAMLAIGDGSTAEV